MNEARLMHKVCIDRCLSVHCYILQSFCGEPVYRLVLMRSLPCNTTCPVSLQSHAWGMDELVHTSKAGPGPAPVPLPIEW